jgi:hypothetical protein
LKKPVTIGIAFLAMALLGTVLVRRGASQYYGTRFEKNNDQEDFLKAVRLWPWHLKWASDYRAIRWMQQDQLKAAPQFLDDRIRDWPFSVAPHAAAALYFEAHGNPASAMERLRTAMNIPAKGYFKLLDIYRDVTRLPGFSSEALGLEAEIEAYLKFAPEESAGAQDLLAHSRGSDWSTAQSWIDEWQKSPIFSANWSGPYRPYRVRYNTVMPLLSPKTVVSSGMDLMSPVALSDRFIFFSARRRHGPDVFSIRLLDTSTGELKDLTDDEGVDEGNLCVDRKGLHAAWRVGKAREKFITVESGGKIRSIGEWPLPFKHCAWIDSNHWVGVTGAEEDQVLWSCKVAQTVSCERTSILKGFSGFVKFLQLPYGKVGFIAFGPDDEFRRPYLLPSDLSRAELLGKWNSQSADVLDFDGSIARLGSHGRYWLFPDDSLQSSHILHELKAVGGSTYGIDSSLSQPRSFAQWEEGRWNSFSQPRAQSLTANPIEFVTEGGLHVPAFVFGDAASKKAVVWWHGGPKENVSPRYNPFFDFLIHQGFQVVAVNYPGSTGLGKAYEKAYNPANLHATLMAVFKQLRSLGVETLVSWSVSTGCHFQQDILDSGFKVSGIIDQAGDLDPKATRLKAQKLGIRYFGLHGRFDQKNPLLEGFDFVYNSGHDLTEYNDFEKLEGFLVPYFSKLTPAH